MKKLLGYEMSFIDIFGRKSACTVGNLFHVITSKHLLVYNLTVLLLLALIDPLGLSNIVPLYKIAVFWIITILVFTIVYVFIASAAIILFSRTRYRYVYFPIIGVISVSINTIFVHIHLVIMNGHVNPGIGFTFNGEGLFFLWGGLIFGDLMIESHFFSYIWPVVEKEIQRKKPSNAPVSPGVRIKGHLVDTRSLLALRAKGHYVDIITLSNTIVVRARLIDIINCFDPALGVQTHRSYWVAKHSIESITNLPSFREVTLTNGDAIPVSASRMATVLSLHSVLPK